MVKLRGGIHTYSMAAKFATVPTVCRSSPVTSPMATTTLTDEKTIKIAAIRDDLPIVISMVTAPTLVEIMLSIAGSGHGRHALLGVGRRRRRADANSDGDRVAPWLPP